jgi:hypothetical protein
MRIDYGFSRRPLKKRRTSRSCHAPNTTAAAATPQ